MAKSGVRCGLSICMWYRSGKIGVLIARDLPRDGCVCHATLTFRGSEWFAMGARGSTSSAEILDSSGGERFFRGLTTGSVISRIGDHFHIPDIGTAVANSAKLSEIGAQFSDAILTTLVGTQV
jgi:hypothetical protein